MAWPKPEPGLVIHYNYLWRRESDGGADHARYPRPCAIVVATRTTDDGMVTVVVAPFTSSPPRDGSAVLEIPPRVCAHLGLDRRTWAVTDEVNVFDWPGFDLEPNDSGNIAWGFIPPALHTRLRNALVAAGLAGRLKTTRRQE